MSDCKGVINESNHPAKTLLLLVNDYDNDNDNDKPIKSLLKGKGLLPLVGLDRLDS
jgi:hypothetical protein